MILAALLVILKVLESAFIVRYLSFEYYIGIVALLFLIFGFWYGRNRSSQEFDQNIALEKQKKLGISNREMEVIMGLSEGLSNKEIGEQLHLSESTVKSHLANVFAKLNAKRRTEVIKIARLEGIIP